MDKNTIIGLVLIAAVLIGFSWYNTNQERNLQQVTTEQTSAPASNQAKQTTQAAPTTIAADSTDIFYAATKGENSNVVLHNNKVNVKISTKGGSISEVRLNEFNSYKDFEAKKNAPLLLYTAKDAGLDFKLDTKVPWLSPTTISNPSMLPIAL